MRYLVIGLTVLIIVGSVCICSGLTLERSIDEIAELLTHSETAYNEGNYSLALEYAKQALEHWNAHKWLFYATLHDSDTSTSEQQINVILRLLETDAEEAAPEFSEAIEALKLISRGERLTTGNIF